MTAALYFNDLLGAFRGPSSCSLYHHWFTHPSRCCCCQFYYSIMLIRTSSPRRFYSLHSRCRVLLPLSALIHHQNSSKKSIPLDEALSGLSARSHRLGNSGGKGVPARNQTSGKEFQLGNEKFSDGRHVGLQRQTRICIINSLAACAGQRAINNRNVAILQLIYLSIHPSISTSPYRISHPNSTPIPFCLPNFHDPSSPIYKSRFET